MIVRVVMERTAAAAAMEARAAAIGRQVAPDRVQPHTRQLPSEAELDAARFAQRQLRIAADDVRAGMHFDEGEV